MKSESRKEEQVRKPIASLLERILRTKYGIVSHDFGNQNLVTVARFSESFSHKLLGESCYFLTDAEHLWRECRSRLANVLSKQNLPKRKLGSLFATKLVRANHFFYSDLDQAACDIGIVGASNDFDFCAQIFACH